MPVQPQQPIQRPRWLSEEVWEFDVRTYFHEGHRLHYLDEGTGPVLVLVHAGMWSFLWRDLVRDLVADYRCLAIDFPGAGLSSGGADAVELSSFVPILNGWLDHLEVGRFTLVLHDLGGVVGASAAATRPEHVEGLVAINSFAWPPQVRSLQRMLRVMGSSQAIGILGSLRFIPRLSTTRFGVGRNFSAADKKAFFGPYRADRGRSRNFHRAMRSAARSSALFSEADRGLRRALAHLPLMTVFGERNDPFHFAQAWLERFPQATSHVLEGGNHFPMCDDAGQVARWIRTWHSDQVLPAHAAIA